MENFKRKFKQVGLGWKIGLCVSAVFTIVCFMPSSAERTARQQTSYMGMTDAMYGIICLVVTAIIFFKIIQKMGRMK